LIACAFQSRMCACAAQFATMDATSLLLARVQQSAAAPSGATTGPLHDVSMNSNTQSRRQPAAGGKADAGACSKGLNVGKAGDAKLDLWLEPFDTATHDAVQALGHIPIIKAGTTCVAGVYACNQRRYANAVFYVLVLTSALRYTGGCCAMMHLVSSSRGPLYTHLHAGSASRCRAS
jgi:hypothetical protein